MKVKKSTLDGVLVIEPPTVFEDHRGCYVETYNRELYHEAGITQDFIQDDVSTSFQNVLRGIHGDEETWKLVSCLHGEFYLVVVNWDKESPQYMKWQGFYISDTNHLQVLIPPKFGNAHLALSELCLFHYKQTTTYNRASQSTLMWNDPDLDIWWPIKKPILSQRDNS